MDDGTRDFLIRLLEISGSAAILIWIISFAVRSAKKHDLKQSQKGVINPPHPSMRGTSISYDEQVANGGPGKYRVQGVDKRSKMDTTWYCEAASQENARVKGELEGIIVTSVTRQ